MNWETAKESSSSLTKESLLKMIRYEEKDHEPFYPRYFISAHEYKKLKSRTEPKL